MAKSFFFICLTLFVYLFGGGAHLWIYLSKYRKAKRNWVPITAEVVKSTAYPKSYGIVPTVKYLVDGALIRNEVMRCYFFLGYSEGDKIPILYDPENPASCFVVSRSLIIKNVCLLIFINFICGAAEIVFINELIKKAADH